MKAAVLLTVFNRKEKTLECLERLFSIPSEGVEFVVYMTDDGSTDGTGEEVLHRFPQVRILNGDGSLFWAGGMNMAWKAAIRDGGYDGYLWLNDDTVLKDNIWTELVSADGYCHEKFGRGGIYVGSTLDKAGERHTYGGLRARYRWKWGYDRIVPDGTFKECDIANGNITYVSSDTVKELGILHPGYKHGVADFDYTFSARRRGIPVIILRDYAGYCDNDHKTPKEALAGKNFKQRIKYLYSPTGLQLGSNLLFQRRFYPYYTPIVFLSYWRRVLFP